MNTICEVHIFSNHNDLFIGTVEVAFGCDHRTNFIGGEHSEKKTDLILHQYDMTE